MNIFTKFMGGAPDFDTAITAARAKLDSLRVRRADILLTAEDAELDKLEADIMRADRDVARTEAAGIEAERLAAEQAAADADHHRKRLYTDAQAAQKAGRSAVKKYPKLAAQVVDLLEEIAIHEAVIAAANDNLPAGVARLESVEQSERGLPEIPGELLSEKRVGTAWYYAGTSSQVDEAKIETRDGKTGWTTSHFGERVEVEKRDIVETINRAAVPAYIPAQLAAAIQLPGYAPNAPNIWTPTGCNGFAPISGDQSDILNAIDNARAALAAKASDLRPSPYVDTTRRLA